MSAKLGVLFVATSLLASCASDVRGVPMAINDPLDLIDDVQGPLRVFVLPAETFTCDATTGAVSPEVPDVAEGMFEEAVADVSLSVGGGRASTELVVPIGAYVVLVRGKGTDTVTGRMNVFIATGCATTMIEEGETREARITLIPIVGMGVCGDGVLSPDEQCEDGGTTDGDGCSAACRTEGFTINTTVVGTQNHAAAGGAVGQRWMFSYDSANTDTFVRLLEPDASPITSPSVLMADADLDTILTTEVAGQELLSDVAVASSGRIAIAFTEFGGGMNGVRVAFMGSNRTAEAPSQAAGPTNGTSNAAIAFAGDGSAMVVFEDGASATGLSGRVFGPGSTMPLGAAAFEVGTGASGGARAAVAGASDHFVVAFAAGGDVFVQRFGADGAPRDAAAINVAEGPGTQDLPGVGAQPDGRVLVAWRDTEGDGAGTAVRARAYAAAGTPSEIFVVNTTTAGDQGGPSVASGNGAFAVAFASGGGVRGRVISADGDPLPNHDQPPTTADFEVAGGGAEPVARVGGPRDTPRWIAVFEAGGDIRARTFPIP